MPDPVTRLNAALEGRYRIERELGEGGMATVYLADDLKHERKVALKVLKPELAAVVGAERFLAEIKTTANLQHPHILPLFDSGEADTFLFYVMPYVEGETLRDRLDREHQLPVDEAVQIAKNVAEALDYAHRQGVIHRDIKPANILLQEGKPVLSDFGIALAVGVAGGGRLTETGLSLGTPHYMSPEQATGDLSVGATTDVYALGCVLYEMLVGEPPYTGSTAQAILGKIIAGKLASATEHRTSVPTNVDAAIKKSLEKVPADRFMEAQDFARALADDGFRHAGELVEGVRAVPPQASRRFNPAFAAATILLAALAAWGWLRPASEMPPAYATRLPIDLGGIEIGDFDEVVVSPNGARFAVTGIVDGERALYWRSADEELFRVVPGAEDAQGANFSPDGDWIAYATMPAGGLYKVSLSGGAPVMLVRPGTVGPNGVYQPHWGDDGTIVFFNPEGSFRVSDTGGAHAPLAGMEEVIHSHLLPGGRGVLGSRLGDAGGVVLVGLGADTARELSPVGFKPKYLETGHVAYVDDSGGLWALPFDVATGDVLGSAVPILDGVNAWVLAQYRFPRYSVSRYGTLVYETGFRGASLGQFRLAVVNLDGDAEASGLSPRALGWVGWLPDGRSVVFEDAFDIYTLDMVLETTPRRLTFEGANTRPAVSPDGTRVAFSAQREGTDGYDLFVKALGDDTPARSVATLATDQLPTQWVSDDLIAFQHGVQGRYDLWTLDLSDPENPRAAEYLSSEADLRALRVSPDGALAAYSSDETGRSEVYVRSFPEPGERTVLSRDGGILPYWSPDGNTVYYRREGTLWAARIRRDPTTVLSRDSLFTAGVSVLANWDLHPDGDRFVAILTPDADGAGADALPTRSLVVTTWFEELRRRLGN